MSISNVLNFEQSYLQKIFGKNEGYWRYDDKDGNFVCYTVRKPGRVGHKKYFQPWTYQNNKLINEWFKDEDDNSFPRPIYQVKSLYDNPGKPVLLVEGEKTADAGTIYLPDYNVITWMGGSSLANNVDISALKGKRVYILPDNDEPGFKAANVLLKNISGVAKWVGLVNIQSIGLRNKWDIADIPEGDIDLDDIRLLISETKEWAPTAEKKKLDYPDLSDGKYPKPLDTTANFKCLLDNHSIVAKWNMMSRTRNVSVPGESFYLEEAENASLTYITNLAVVNNLPVKRVDKHLDAIAFDNRYHPVRDWILSAEQNQPEVFNEFLKTIKTTNDELSYILIKKWMLSAVYALFSEGGFCAQGVLVLQGGGGTHKSTFIMDLAPQELRAVKGGLSLDPSKKDDIFTSSEYWITELGELDATFRKADIARLKSHITNDIDVVRRPHAVRNSQMIRRTVYAATVNESRFLVDKTGNRRWWTISVTEPIRTRHGLDMQQIWRHVYDLYLKGESPFLDECQMAHLNKMNEQFEYLDPFEDKIETAFNWEIPNSQWLTPSQVLQRIGYDKPSGSDCTRMGILLGKKNIIKGSGRYRRFYHMPSFY